jgi:hypothetical protein
MPPRVNHFRQSHDAPGFRPAWSRSRLGPVMLLSRPSGCDSNHKHRRDDGLPASLAAVHIPVSNPRGGIFLGSNAVRIDAAFKIFDSLLRESAFELTLPCLDTALNSAPPV